MSPIQRVGPLILLVVFLAHLFNRSYDTAELYRKGGGFQTPVANPRVFPPVFFFCFVTAVQVRQLLLEEEDGDVEEEEEEEERWGVQ